MVCSKRLTEYEERTAWLLLINGSLVSGAQSDIEGKGGESRTQHIGKSLIGCNMWRGDLIASTSELLQSDIWTNFTNVITFFPLSTGYTECGLPSQWCRNWWEMLWCCDSERGGGERVGGESTWSAFGRRGREWTYWLQGQAKQCHYSCTRGVPWGHQTWVTLPKWTSADYLSVSQPI